MEMLDWLQLSLQSHRYALKLSEDNPDTLFNTAQVLTTLAEGLSEEDRSEEAVPLLHEALELLSSCLSKQEMMYEQHQLDFPDNEDGGVPLEPDEKPAPAQDNYMQDEQSAIVEVPVSAADLLDTVHASLSALITLVPLADQPGLETIGTMAQTLTESKAPDYIKLLPAEGQDKARFSMAVDRAAFVASFANAQFEFQIIELQTYVERLDTFNMPNKETDATALNTEAEARTELVLACFDRFGESSDLPAMLCWKQLSLSQDLYTQSTKLNSEDAQERKAETYKAKGDLELLRHRVANVPKADVSDGVRKSAKTLIQNAQTYYKGAVSHAKASGDEDVEEEAQQRLELAKAISALMYGGDQAAVAPDALMKTLQECVDEGCVSEQLAQAMMSGSFASGS